MSRLQRIAAIVELYAVLLGCVATIGFVGYRSFHRPTPVFEATAVPIYGAVPVVFFFMPGCEACAVAKPSVEALAARYPKQVARVDSSTADGMELVRQYYTAYCVPKEKQNKIPIAFAGERFFLGFSEVGQDLPAYVQQAMAKGSLHAPPLPKAETASAG
jgi:hypothetical protein